MPFVTGRSRLRENFPHVSKVRFKGILSCESRSPLIETTLDFTEEDLPTWITCPKCAGKIYILHPIAYEVLAKKKRYYEGELVCSGVAPVGIPRKSCNTRLRFILQVEYE